MSTGMLGPRLMAWGMTASGLGIGLIVAAFVGEDTPILAVWGAALSIAGLAMVVASRIVESRRNE